MSMIQKLTSVIGTCIVFSGIVFPLNTQESAAQSCKFFLGKTFDGKEINLDTCSIALYLIPEDSHGLVELPVADFAFYVGAERFLAATNCDKGNGYWTYPERHWNTVSNSPSTRKMLELVCDGSRPSVSQNGSPLKALLFDPPSNIRIKPNGSIICTIENSETINIIYRGFGNGNESWYYTDACGRNTIGVIHESQIRF